MSSLIARKRTNRFALCPIQTVPVAFSLTIVCPGRTFQHFSLADAYYNKFTKKEREQLKDMVLLFGGTATATNDIRPNVFDPAIDGVENHAAVIDNIIRGDFMRRPVEIYKRVDDSLSVGPAVLATGYFWLECDVWIGGPTFLGGILAFDCLFGSKQGLGRT